MLQVKHLLEVKGSEIFGIDPDAPVLDAIKRMAEKRIGALLVMRGAELLGVISERDYARKVILQGHSSSNTSVASIMASPVLTVSPESTVAECMRLCTDRRVRHLPVLDGNRVVGIVSIGDLVKAVIDEQAQEIEHLHNYIAG